MPEEVTLTASVVEEGNVRKPPPPPPAAAPVSAAQPQRAVGGVVIASTSRDSDSSASNANNSSSKKQRKRRRSDRSMCSNTCKIITVLIFLAIGGALAWLILRVKPGDQPGSSKTDDADDAASNLLYDPPSVVNCDKISKRQTIGGRNQLDRVDFGLKFEVTTPTADTMTPELMQSLIDEMQRLQLPSLAGCSEAIGPNTAEFRFVIYDALIQSRGAAEECGANQFRQGPCTLVPVELQLYLKGPIDLVDVIAMVAFEFEYSGNPEKFLLTDDIKAVRMAGIDVLTATQPPTASP